MDLKISRWKFAWSGSSSLKIFISYKVDCGEAQPIPPKPSDKDYYTSGMTNLCHITGTMNRKEHNTFNLSLWSHHTNPSWRHSIKQLTRVLQKCHHLKAGETERNDYKWEQTEKAEHRNALCDTKLDSGTEQAIKRKLEVINFVLLTVMY
jgi:hypothetical protein